MTVVDFMTVLSFALTFFSAGVAVGKYFSDNKNDRLYLSRAVAIILVIICRMLSVKRQHLFSKIIII